MSEFFARWFEFYEFKKILWSRRMKEIICNGDYFILYPLFNFQPVKGYKCESDIGMFSGASDSANKCIFNLLKAFNLRERTFVVKTVTITKTRVYEGSGDSSGSGKIKIVTDTMEVTNMAMADAR